MQKFFQGGSVAATPIKQDGVVGIFDLQATRWKNYNPLVFVDLYAGSGRNVIGGESINGSPLSILGGIYRAVSKSRSRPPHPWLIVFNDIAPGRATSLLPENVMRWQEENGLPVNADSLCMRLKDGSEFVVPIKYLCGPSDDVVQAMRTALDAGFRAHFVMLVDPNGPKDAPWPDLQMIWNRHGRYVDLVLHIAATILKRVSKARDSVGYDFAPMPNHIAGMLDLFTRCGGWIREPVGADQWTIAMISKYPPKSGWAQKNASFHLINSPDGQQTIKRLTYTKKEIKNASQQDDLNAA